MRALEHEQRLAARERETLHEAEARMHQREDALRQREETFRRRLNEELDAQVRQARREIDDVIAELKAKTAAIAQSAPRLVSTGETGAARSDARAAVDEHRAARLLGRRRAAAATDANPQSPASGMPPCRRRRPRDRRRARPRGGRHRRFTTAPRISTCAASACAPACAICASCRPREPAARGDR